MKDVDLKTARLRTIIRPEGVDLALAGTNRLITFARILPHGIDPSGERDVGDVQDEAKALAEELVRRWEAAAEKEILARAAPG